MRKENLHSAKNLSNVGFNSGNSESIMKERPHYADKLGVLLTEKCNIRCRHCMLSCDSNNGSSFEWDTLAGLINEIHELGYIKTVSFTGGEAFLEIEKLSRGIALCNELGLRTTVVTNAYWAYNEKNAVCMLSRMITLAELHVSTDSFHQEFVPIENVKNAILSCHQLKIKCLVSIAYLHDPVSEIRTVEEQLKDVQGLYQIRYQPVHPVGRAATQIGLESIYKYNIEKVRCGGIYRPSVTPDGKVSACCGSALCWQGNHHLCLGNIRNERFGAILQRADCDPILHMLGQWGHIKLLELILKQAKIENYDLIMPSISEMTGICTLCEYIFTDENMTWLLKRAVQDMEGSAPDINTETVVDYLRCTGGFASALQEVAGRQRAVKAAGEKGLSFSYAKLQQASDAWRKYEAYLETNQLIFKFRQTLAAEAEIEKIFTDPQFREAAIELLYAEWMAGAVK